MGIVSSLPDRSRAAEALSKAASEEWRAWREDEMPGDIAVAVFFFDGLPSHHPSAPPSHEAECTEPQQMEGCTSVCKHSPSVTNDPLLERPVLSTRPVNSSLNQITLTNHQGTMGRRGVQVDSLAHHPSWGLRENQNPVRARETFTRQPRLPTPTQRSIKSGARINSLASTMKTVMRTCSPHLD